MGKWALLERIADSADAVLQRQGHVSAIDMLTQARVLEPVHVQAWRRGRVEYLEQEIQWRGDKLGEALEFFQVWAGRNGLRAEESQPEGRDGASTAPLRFTANDDPARDRVYRLRYFRPSATDRERRRIVDSETAAPDLLVYDTLRDSVCGECQAELGKGALIVLEKGAAVCLACADLDHLVWLPRGDAALSRRARKYSGLAAIVLRFSRARKHYERQGLLVDEAALERAESECLEDEAARAARRARDAERRDRGDADLARRALDAIRTIFPGCPAAEAESIARHTMERGSGRVGRSDAGRELDPEALRLAVRAHVRHRHTEYDSLLMHGVDRAAARGAVVSAVDAKLHAWADPNG